MIDEKQTYIVTRNLLNNMRDLRILKSTHKQIFSDEDCHNISRILEQGRYCLQALTAFDFYGSEPEAEKYRIMNSHMDAIIEYNYAVDQLIRQFSDV